MFLVVLVPVTLLASHVVEEIRGYHMPVNPLTAATVEHA
jgi:hypothetical protein